MELNIGITKSWETAYRPYIEQWASQTTGVDNLRLVLIHSEK